MIHQSVLAAFLSASLLPPAPQPPSAPAERPLTVALATQAQAMDARLQVRPTAQTDPAAQPAPKEGMSRGKKIAIIVGIVAGAALLWVALDNGDDNGGSGGSGGGGY